MTALTDHRSYLTDVLARQAARRTAADPAHTYAPQPVVNASHLPPSPPSSEPEAGPSRPSKTNVVNYVPAEEAVRNDYAAWYGVSGEFPSNHVLGAGEKEVCEEFPALRRLMDLKAEHVAAAAHPPLVIPLASAHPSSVANGAAPHRFDVILIHPTTSWAETAQLPIRQLSADPGFVFLWVGTGDADGLERGRECLAKWGFRRAEDIVWVKTNRMEREGRGGAGGGLFASQKEHCLMGIRGTVRRSTDSRFVHCNVDTDVIVAEQGINDPPTPSYLYTLIENFCLGSRRLEVFGDAATARRGWVTATTSSAPIDNLPEAAQLFDTSTYSSLLPSKEEGKPVLPFHPEIDMLRPKSPQRRGARGTGGTGGIGGSLVRPNPTGSPPPTPPFRGGGSGVMRMGALTPAQGAGNYSPGMVQGMFAGGQGGSGVMAMGMAAGGGHQPYHGGHHMAQQHQHMQYAGMMGGPQGGAMAMAMGGPMGGPMGMRGVQGMQRGGGGGMAMGQMGQMGMGGMGGMAMGMGVLPDGSGYMHPAQQAQVAAQMQMAQLAQLQMSQMQMAAMYQQQQHQQQQQQGYAHGGVSPNPAAAMYGGSPQMGGGMVPLDDDGHQVQQAQGDWSGQHNAMSQLAMGFGAMGVPYLGGQGYPFNG